MILKTSRTGVSQRALENARKSGDRVAMFILSWILMSIFFVAAVRLVAGTSNDDNNVMYGSHMVECSLVRRRRPVLCNGSVNATEEG